VIAAVARGALLCRWLALAVCIVWLPAGAAQADAARPLVFHWRVEGPLLIAGSTTWLLSEALKPVLAPERCRLCGVGSVDGSIHDALLWSRPRPAKALSDALLFGITPVVALASSALLVSSNLRSTHARQQLTVDLLIQVEAFVLTANLTQIVKLAVARERPYAFAASSAGTTRERASEDNLSFFSGHASWTFAMAAAAGTTATLRGYKQAPIVWAVGMPLAAFTGYLRMAANRHYFTDVLTGALVGTAVGVLIPWLHAREPNDKLPAVSFSGQTVTLSWLR
jgi:membrane-associated phospholipid phosphatase